LTPVNDKKVKILRLTTNTTTTVQFANLVKYHDNLIDKNPTLKPSDIDTYIKSQEPVLYKKQGNKPEDNRWRKCIITGSGPRGVTIKFTKSVYSMKDVQIGQLVPFDVNKHDKRWDQAPGTEQKIRADLLNQLMPVILNVVKESPNPALATKAIQLQYKRMNPNNAQITPHPSHSTVISNETVPNSNSSYPALMLQEQRITTNPFKAQYPSDGLN
jgi:hypothetical protein